MNIRTLIPDIQDLIVRKDGWFTDEHSRSLGDDLARRLAFQLGEKKAPPKLRLSQMGPRCPKALWHSIHTPALAEPLPPWAEIKYSFGTIIEALTITLAKASGHHVVGEQDEVSVDGILGHRDCVIDGCIVDVKSAASPSFQKFLSGKIRTDDGFGYLDQLDGYLVGSLDDPLVLVKDRAYLLAIDKQLGHMCLYEHRIREEHIRSRIESYKRIVELDKPPACRCGTEKDGESGNFKLDKRASYEPYKYCCFPHLRKFIYANGPRYLTKVVRKPDVMEVDRYDRVVYN